MSSSGQGDSKLLHREESLQKYWKWCLVICPAVVTSDLFVPCTNGTMGQLIQLPGQETKCYRKETK